MIADLHLEREDLYGHAIAGAVIGMVGHGLIEEFLPDAPRPVKLVLKLAGPVVAGSAKEWVYDRHHGGDVDWRDAAATAGGGVMAVSLTWRF